MRIDAMRNGGAGGGGEMNETADGAWVPCASEHISDSVRDMKWTGTPTGARAQGRANGIRNISDAK